MAHTKNTGTAGAGEAAALPADRLAEPQSGDYVPDYPGQAARDRRDALARQLCALTAMLHGNGGDTFRNWSGEIQDDVLWLAHDLARQVRDLCERGAA